ncbi:hypothetical protein EVAR_68435_1 [Eumeta japonica]|uniref:Uncharacterized protein n=1 Tax=Eumeta variegata TaxID=151549 RepID=A0A4C2A3U3_EUMVA|nr:hypothetical protein EVAR_68435_1 [Eumeta japonica]
MQNENSSRQPRCHASSQPSTYFFLTARLDTRLVESGYATYTQQHNKERVRRRRKDFMEDTLSSVYRRHLTDSSSIHNPHSYSFKSSKHLFMNRLNSHDEDAVKTAHLCHNAQRHISVVSFALAVRKHRYSSTADFIKKKCARDIRQTCLPTYWMYITQAWTSENKTEDGGQCGINSVFVKLLQQKHKNNTTMTLETAVRTPGHLGRDVRRHTRQMGERRTFPDCDHADVCGNNHGFGMFNFEDD